MNDGDGKLLMTLVHENTKNLTHFQAPIVWPWQGWRGAEGSEWALGLSSPQHLQQSRHAGVSVKREAHGRRSRQSSLKQQKVLGFFGAFQGPFPILGVGLLDIKSALLLARPSCNYSSSGLLGRSADAHPHTPNQKNPADNLLRI